ncbi:MATE family efflux transporter [Veronia nyctiphanis]|uniref:Multidrug resistance protein NorM n=1 Tax=Veronia nyctiphanis TaxID=1278244 RepID=A0A4Q0YXA3_9GAMM|nr:MATE family efflux transporter [Veronia nyctiphanis]RXJ73691.1 MATE family efflux transporter [Veronia nyctiphanis]
MQDLTTGPIHRHIISMAVPIATGLLIQTLYFLIDLYFVGQLGDAALAGVSAAGNLFFFNMALTQILNVGCATLVAHAMGRKDREKAESVYSHAMFYGITSTIIICLLGYSFGGTYLDALASTAEVQILASQYFNWFLPSLALQFILVVITASMRGAGLVKPFMAIQVVGIITNAILSPLLITGAGGLFPQMEVSGAALASSVSALLVLLLAIGYLYNNPKTLTLQLSKVRPNWPVLRSLLKVGVPAGSEFMLTFFYMAMIYWALSQFGSAEQAGFGLGTRISQSLFLPVMAIAFATPAIAGQNFAAGKFERVHATYKISMVMTVSLMALVALPCIFAPEIMLTPFSSDPEVILVAATFLSFIGFNFVPTGIVMTSSGMFQSFGNTLPSLASTFIRVGTFSLCLIYLVSKDNFEVTTIWLLSVSTVFVQAAISYTLLQKAMKKKVYGRMSDMKEASAQT